MSMIEAALRSANDYELPLAHPAGSTPDERRLIAIGHAVENTRIVQQLAWREAHLPNGTVCVTVTQLLTALLAAGDTVNTVEATPAEMRAASEWQQP